MTADEVRNKTIQKAEKADPATEDSQLRRAKDFISDPHIDINIRLQIMQVFINLGIDEKEFPVRS